MTKIECYKSYTKLYIKLTMKTRSIVWDREKRVDSFVKKPAKRIDSIVKERAMRINNIVKERAKCVIIGTGLLCETSFCQKYVLSKNRGIFQTRCLAKQLFDKTDFWQNNFSIFISFSIYFDFVLTNISAQIGKEHQRVLNLMSRKRTTC